jgi:hypothetical protein
VLSQLGERLLDSRRENQMRLLRAVGGFGRQGVATAPAVIAVLEASDGRTDHFFVAECLTTLRALKCVPLNIRERLVLLLRESSTLYRERPRREVIWLRSYMFSTLAAIGVPDSAYPFLLDAIANADEKTHAVHCGAAVRAVGSMGERAKPILPYLLDAFTRPLPLNDFSLERYDTRYPPSEATTVQLEIVRTFEAIKATEDPIVMVLLRSLANAGADGTIADQRLQAEARRILKL